MILQNLCVTDPCKIAEIFVFGMELVFWILLYSEVYQLLHNALEVPILLGFNITSLGGLCQTFGDSLLVSFSVSTHSVWFICSLLIVTSCQFKVCMIEAIYGHL
jgi:hypothetical protein